MLKRTQIWFQTILKMKKLLLILLSLGLYAQGQNIIVSPCDTIDIITHPSNGSVSIEVMNSMQLSNLGITPIYMWSTISNGYVIGEDSLTWTGFAWPNMAPGTQSFTTCITYSYLQIDTFTCCIDLYWNGTIWVIQTGSLPSWDCPVNSPGGCYDPGTGMGTYTSLASCQSACVINSGLLCDSIVVTGSQTQLTMQVNNFNAFIYHWISMAPDGTVLGEDSMWNNHLVYNSFTIPNDTITTCITYPDAGTLVTCCIHFVWDATTGLWAKMAMQTTINEIKAERKLIKIVDILGKTTTKHKKSNQILFYIYDDGSTEKIYSE